MNGAKDGMTMGEVCPDEVKSDRIALAKAFGQPKTRPIGPRRGSWFPNAATSPIINIGFGDHLGNVG